MSTTFRTIDIWQVRCDNKLTGESRVVKTCSREEAQDTAARLNEGQKGNFLVREYFAEFYDEMDVPEEIYAPVGGHRGERFCAD